MTDTIYAQASARGRAGVAVIRISGPGAFATLEDLTGPRPADRTAALRRVRAPDGEVVDHALTLCFPGPASFTGEDVAELQVHGGPAICAAVLDLIGGRPGTRLAEPGEFTRRALLNGRLDLAQVEGLGDMLAAETEAQRRQAARLMSGALSGQAARWREALVRALAFVEASIDFVDDAVPDDVLQAVMADLEGLSADLRAAVKGAGIAERIREGFEIALVGAPNVGKSTLLNALAGREAAITSAVAGTTRDVIEVRMDLGGLPVTLLDMAGLRVTEDTVERMGVDRARGRADRADLRVFLVEASGEVEQLGVASQPGDVVVRAKADLARARPGALAVSGVTGAGIRDLLAAVRQELEKRVQASSGISHRRQAVAIGRAAEAVDQGLAQIRNDRPEIGAAELHRAVRALDFLVGKVDVDAILDKVFESFCLGK
ncbi:tRNA uridine-5-carboxymethylaminomethyl(34) synthesis GTPase MnmE [Amaricoccus solimangrovi]|uniref:tRNA modification GTPase MnmE n=1 Tax=Amaricoccus solimangrovi TaxID=2589815 RepID=A0A501WUY7_9RHOB|nr:tRNA uridine-5-carboxymethylaminomethyl(34) synthesis GTPase MnmE [Amaricoccus solimangrovi]TPE52552.1 tRNA uridine-5-carboxymethylaminomethyl(34) synthesis GTPase MnmE [Amaricoccus solimangrovi]